MGKIAKRFLQHFFKMIGPVTLVGALMHQGFTRLVGLDRRLQSSDARCLNLAQLGCLVALLRT